MSSTPRDPSTLTDADLSTMTEEEEARYYEVNAHRLDEIFDEDAKVEFEVPEDATTTITVRLKRSELEVLSQAAELRDLKLSTYVRETALLVARSPQAIALPGDAATVNRKLAAVKKQISDLEGLIASKPVPSKHKSARTGAGKSRIADPKAARAQLGARARKSA
jgi:hypothetical protein